MSFKRREPGSRWPKLPTFAGDGLIERLRTTSFAILGVTAIGGMATVGLLASAGYPDLPPGPPPTGPQQAIGSAHALSGPGGSLTGAEGTSAGVTVGIPGSVAATVPTLVAAATLPGTGTPGNPDSATGPNFGGGTEGVELGGATLPVGAGSNSPGDKGKTGPEPVIPVPTTPSSGDQGTSTGPTELAVAPTAPIGSSGSESGASGEGGRELPGGETPGGGTAGVPDPEEEEGEAPDEGGEGEEPEGPEGEEPEAEPPAGEAPEKQPQTPGTPPEEETPEEPRPEPAPELPANEPEPEPEVAPEPEPEVAPEPEPAQEAEPAPEPEPAQ